jgi:hypothetical protein
LAHHTFDGYASNIGPAIAGVWRGANIRLLPLQKNPVFVFSPAGHFVEEYNQADDNSANKRFGTAVQNCS